MQFQCFLRSLTIYSHAYLKEIQVLLFFQFRAELILAVNIQEEYEYIADHVTLILLLFLSPVSALRKSA